MMADLQTPEARLDVKLMSDNRFDEWWQIFKLGSPANLVEDEEMMCDGGPPILDADVQVMNDARPMYKW